MKDRKASIGQAKKIHKESAKELKELKMNGMGCGRQVNNIKKKDYGGITTAHNHLTRNGAAQARTGPLAPKRTTSPLKNPETRTD